MNILYYTWNEITYKDMYDTLLCMGHDVDSVCYKMSNYLVDRDFIELMEDKIDNGNYDCIFTVDYFPVISKISLNKKIKYISWVYDCPCWTVYSVMSHNPYNYIFHFDKLQVERLRKMGVTNIYHMPLAVNTRRVLNQINNKTTDAHYINDISFMGNLYNDEHNFFDKIEGLSEYESGYIDAIINSQLLFMGADIIDDSISDVFLNGILEKVDINLDDELMVSQRDIILSMIRKKATVIERRQLIESLSDKFNVSLYSQSDSSFMKKVSARGYIDYYEDMSKMFNRSKINLNITLRSILSGISLRALDIMGAGGFLLSNYQPELAELFEDGKEFVMYYSRQDLMDKAAYYLEHDEERELIARNGQKKIIEQYDYSLVWEKIFNIVNN